MAPCRPAAVEEKKKKRGRRREVVHKENFLKSVILF